MSIKSLCKFKLKYLWVCTRNYKHIAYQRSHFSLTVISGNPKGDAIVQEIRMLTANTERKVFVYVKEMGRPSAVSVESKRDKNV